MQRIRGTQENVLPLEIGSTAVYIRDNIVKVKSESFSGWEYDEEKLTKDEFIYRIHEDNHAMKQSQAESSTVLLEFMESMLIGGI